MLNGVITVLISMFLQFHINLAIQGKTTIENLEHKNKDYVSEFDIGIRRNWLQIFGSNPILWPFPMFCGSGKPCGDGIYWPKQSHVKELERQ